MDEMLLYTRGVRRAVKRALLVADMPFGSYHTDDREALANAILHGCKADPTKKVECSVNGDRKEGIVIVVRDPGTGFDPKSIQSPTENSNLGADHGRGIFLIQALMDEVTHEQNGTVIRMRKL